MNTKIISVIVPAFNEEKAIFCTVKEIIQVLHELATKKYEIIVIDDGSIDQTYAQIKDLAQKFKGKVKTITYHPNMGKGYAIREGALIAEGEYIFYIDADLEIHPNQIKGFLELMQKTGADAIVGSKTTKGSQVKLPFKRKILSKGYYSLLKLLFHLPITDTQTGFKLFKKKALKECILKTTINRYAFDLELLSILNIHNYKIVESPILINHSRLRRIKFKDIFSIFKDTLSIFIRIYITKSYF